MVSYLSVIFLQAEHYLFLKPTSLRHHFETPSPRILKLSCEGTLTFKYKDRKRGWGGVIYTTLKLVTAAAAKSLQSCLTLCDPIDSSPPGSPVPGILQASTLEWVAISFSNAWKWKVKWIHSVVSDSYWPHGLQPTSLLCPWDFPGKSTGVGCHCLLQS